MNLILHLFVNTLAVLTGAYLLKGVKVDGMQTAVVVAIVLGLVNTFIKPVLIFLTLPLTLLTLGLFILVINALSGKWVVCRVNDRGPAKRLNRQVDLTKAAFAKIAKTKQGLVYIAFLPLENKV